jgi:hypothetical protein
MRKFLAAMLCIGAACGGSSDKKNEPPTVATPVFSVAGGTYTAPQSVTITCSTAGAAIHFTIDGTTPSATSPTYSAAIAVTTTTTIKAMATLSGSTDSAVASATYTLQAAAPVFSPVAGTYTTSQSVTLTSATPGAAVHFTVDGTTPTASSPSYSTPIAVAATTTIKAMATRGGFADSPVTSAAYVIDANATPTATPTFSPAPGTFGSTQSVTITCATAGATIYYTTSGADPTTASAVYSGAIPVSTTTTIKAIATAPGHTQSLVASGTYTINAPQPVATPVLSPTPGTYTSTQSVTITCATAGATIHYTADGTTPTGSSPTYSAAITVAATTTIKAMATHSGYTDSAVASGTYTIDTGTSFTTLCAVFTTVQENLQATCMKMNPALFTAPGRYQFTFCADIQKEITAGRSVYDSTQGTACLVAFQAITCTDLTPGNGIPTPVACNAALTGTVAAGGSCYASNSCQAGYCTSDYTQSCPGTCQPFAQLNQPCSSTPCADGLACDYYFSGGTPVCKTASGLNGACPCQDAYWCDASGGSPGVCRAFRTAGGACSYFGFECAAGFECVGAGLPTPPGTCQALVGGGATCGSTAPCGTGYVCSGTCTSLPAVGQSCVQGTGGLDCIGGYCPGVPSPTCQAYKAPGTACTVAYECASGRCSGSPTVCQPLTCSAP